MIKFVDKEFDFQTLWQAMENKYLPPFKSKWGTRVQSSLRGFGPALILEVMNLEDDENVDKSCRYVMKYMSEDIYYFLNKEELRCHVNHLLEASRLLHVNIFDDEIQRCIDILKDKTIKDNEIVQNIHMFYYK